MCGAGLTELEGWRGVVAERVVGGAVVAHFWSLLGFWMGGGGIVVVRADWGESER